MSPRTWLVLLAAGIALAGTAQALPEPSVDRAVGAGSQAVYDAVESGPSSVPQNIERIIESPSSAGAPGSNPAPPTAPGLSTPPSNSSAALLVAGFAGVASLAGLVVWGGTRFRSQEEILEHEIRSQIYAFVQQRVGASLKDITDHLGLSTTNAVWHLRKLEEGSLVKGKKFNGAKVYYPTAGGVQARNLSIAGAALANANARTILQFIATHPGVHQREIARLLSVNHGTVRWHLKKLRHAELLEERRSGPHAAYHPTDLGSEALRVAFARGPIPASAAEPAPAQVVSMTGQA